MFMNIQESVWGTVLTGGDQFQDSEGRGSRQKVDSWSCISRKQNLVFGIPRPPFKNPKKRSLEMCSWNAVTVLQMPKPTWTASRKHCKKKKRWASTDILAGSRSLRKSWDGCRRGWGVKNCSQGTWRRSSIQYLLQFVSLWAIPQKSEVS